MRRAAVNFTFRAGLGAAVGAVLTVGAALAQTGAEIAATLDVASLSTDAATSRDQLAAERRSLEEDLADLGIRILERESTLNAARERIHALRDDVADAQERLDAAAERLRRLMVAAQLAAREPTPSLLVHPDRPVVAARSALLLRRLAEALRAANNAARDERDRIATARADAERLAEDARRELFALQNDESRVQALLRLKQDAWTKASKAAEAAAKAAEAERLREESASLTDLAAAIDRAEPIESPDLAENPVEPDALAEPITPRAATPRRRASRPFDRAQGAMLRPVAGRLADNGDDRKRGVTFITQPFARVISPWSGIVRYSGTFRGYGHIVIIEPQNDYQILLTGLASVNLKKGERVLAGQPIGRMGGPPPSNSEFLFEVSTSRADVERLYLEIREDGDAVRPDAMAKAENVKSERLEKRSPQDKRRDGT